MKVNINKKKIIICVIVFSFFLFSLVGYLIYDNRNKSNLFWGGNLQLSCKISNDTFDENEIFASSYVDNIGKNDLVDCYLQLDNNEFYNAEQKDDYISDIWISKKDLYNSSLFDTISISSSDDWKFEDNEKDIHFSSNSANAKLSDLNFKFKINFIDSSRKKTSVYVGNVIFKFSLDDIKYNELLLKSNEFNTYNYRSIINSKTKTIKFYELNNSNEFKFISEYETDNDPKIDMNYNTGVSLIYDANGTILYDINNGIIAKYDIGPVTYNLFNDEKSSDSELGDLIYTRDSSSGDGYGIVDLFGNIIHSFSLGGTHNVGSGSGKIYNGEYSIISNVIVDKKNNKYGLSRIRSDEMFVDYIYDDISIINDKYFKARTGDSWMIYSLKTGEKLIDKPYELILLPNDEILLVQEDGYLYFEDLSGNKLNNNGIEVLAPYLSEWQLNNNSRKSGISYKIKGDRIIIYAYNSNEINAKFIEYEYYTKSNLLIKVGE